MRLIETTDACIYEPDAIAVSVLLFGPRTCSKCGLELGACTDYFAPSKQNHAGLVRQCRRCRRALERDRWARLQEKGVSSHDQLDFFAAAGA